MASRMLLISPAVDDMRLERIRAAATGRIQVVNATSASQALERVADATAFFGKVTPELLAASRQLEWVQTATASLEHYLFPELIAHPCQLTNMRGLFSDVIADHVMGYVLSFARNLHLYIRQQLQRRWEPVGGESARSDFLSGNGVVNEIDRRHQHLSDCSLGVVGAGAIGTEVLRRATAFGMKLYAVDARPRAADGSLPAVWPVDRLAEMLPLCDYVVIAAPHTPATYKMFQRDQFRQMKPTGVLINVGRGAIVDLSDLTLALRDGTIGGAALDVAETEPLPEEHALWGMDNVIITPHVAAASPRIAERHLQTFLDNLEAYLTGRPFMTLVDKNGWC